MELQREYRFASDKIRIISNPVDLKRLRQPPEFDRAAFRRQLGFSGTDTVLAFAALGHFERKGLPLLLEAIARVARRDLGLIVVGGEERLIAEYKRRVRLLGIQNQVRFVGMQCDLGPYFWAADGFAFPSSYETFSLVSFEAAAAGLPLLVTRLYGVEELLVHGMHGFELPRDPEGIAEMLAP